jgi:hypothetical protein
MSLLGIILLVLLLLTLGSGYYGTTNLGWGHWGWSPVGIVLLILIVLLLTGRL